MAKELRINKTYLAVLLALAVCVMFFLLYSGAGRGQYVEETVKISELLSASIQLAEMGGAEIVEIRKMDSSQIGQVAKGLTKEGKDEYVTLGDLTSHKIITSGLTAAWPHLHYRSEETERNIMHVSPPSKINREVQGVARRDEAVALDKIAVWVDPLDATHEYTESEKDPSLLDYVTVMVCIAVDGEPIAGVIHQPYMKDVRTGKTGVTKWAWVGHGVSRSLQREISSASKNDDQVRVIASRSHPGEVFQVARSSFEGHKEVKEIIAAGAGYKALQVAERKADLYLHTTAIKKWDICAGNAVLNTLGGKMTTRKGQIIDYGLEGDPNNSDGLIATNTESDFNDFLPKLKL